MSLIKKTISASITALLLAVIVPSASAHEPMSEIDPDCDHYLILNIGGWEWNYARCDEGSTTGDQTKCLILNHPIEGDDNARGVCVHIHPTEADIYVCEVSYENWGSYGYYLHYKRCNEFLGHEILELILDLIPPIPECIPPYNICPTGAGPAPASHPDNDPDCYRAPDPVVFTWNPPQPCVEQDEWQYGEDDSERFVCVGVHGLIPDNFPSENYEICASGHTRWESGNADRTVCVGIYNHDYNEIGEYRSGNPICQDL